MTDDTLHPLAQPLAPTTGLLTKAITSLRAFATDTHPSDDLNAYVGAIARYVIQHIVETLRQAGLADEARRILAGELEDLHVLKATSEGPYAVNTSEGPYAVDPEITGRTHIGPEMPRTPSKLTISRDVVAICDKAFARPPRDAGNLTVIPGGRR